MFEAGVIFFMIYVTCVYCLIVVPLPPGKTPFAIKINNIETSSEATWRTYRVS
jgi:hypothetical protein